MQDSPVIIAKENLASAIAGLDPLIHKLEAELETLQDETCKRHQSNALCHLKNISQSAREFWAYIMIERNFWLHKSPSEQQRIADNITHVSCALKSLTQPSLSIQWTAICKIHYVPSCMEKCFANAKKILMTLCAAIAGFVACTLMGMTITGGITGVPAAILASLKSIASIWQTAGAGAATIALGPSLFGLMMAQGQLVKETSAPLENEMIKVKASLIHATNDKLQHVLYRKMYALHALGTPASRRAYQMLEAVLQRANEHVSTASRWYCLDDDARRNRAQTLYLAIDEVLTHLLSLNPPTPADFSKETILSLTVTLNGQSSVFGKVLLTPRIFPTLKGSFFARDLTETSRRANEAWDRQPISLSPKVC